MITGMIREKLGFYFKNKTKIHIKDDKNSFYNGIILEFSEEHIVFLDRKLGEVFLVIDEIIEVEIYKEVGA